MEFKKYQHVERFGTEETDGIDLGLCWIFPKIDGSNASIWFDGTSILCGSRNRVLSLDNDNQGFCQWVKDNKKTFTVFFEKHPTARLYGEWLVPHTLRTYRPEAWRNFYVFDVVENGEYLTYDQYNPILKEHNITFIPPIASVKNPTWERLQGQLEKNTYLIQDGAGTGEGIIIKNYDYKNKFGRIVWAKIVKNEFKDKHRSQSLKHELKEKQIVEQQIVDKYVSETLINKEFEKIKSENGWASKRIPQLLNTVFYCLIKEECWNFVKEHKNPKIDFNRLFALSTQKIKETKPELF